MKRSIILFFAFLALAASAQVEEKADSGATNKEKVSMMCIGYLSYDNVLRTMPGYKVAEGQVAELRESFEKEMKRVEDEFNEKYETFLEERAQYPRTILLKRQQELQDMIQQNIAFRNRCREDLEKSRQEAMAPLRHRLNEAITAVARQQSLILVVNTDADACPFIEPTLSLDITDLVVEELNEGDAD